ncbi:aminotransferase class V-fold PLP-dependent enzyme [Nocardioides sp. C4-1]|uniref:aminotransferase class V-fold PLP-dependent enzyme n=1 Tax=Nocardioides sp. C4-1 TaxID=3151851 RepID=UPI003264F7C7
MPRASSHLTLMREDDDPVARTGTAPSARPRHRRPDVDGHGVHRATHRGTMPGRHELEGRLLGLVADLVDAPEHASGVVATGVDDAAVAVLRGARDAVVGPDGGDAGPSSVVLPRSAHPAYFAAALTVGLTPIVVAVDDEGRADLGALTAAVRADTVLIVASAPSYTHGLVDPVAWIAAAAQARGVPLHVDATCGGWAMAHAARTGQLGTLWGFAIRGVASVAIDVGPDGRDDTDLVAVLHRDPAGARALTVSTPTRGPLALPTAWARPSALLEDTVDTLGALGATGWADLAAAALAATRTVVDGLAGLPGVRLAARPEATVVSLVADGTCDVFTLSDALHALGWTAHPVLPDDGEPLLRVPVTAAVLPRVDGLLAALADAVAEAQARGPARVEGTLERLLPRFEAPVGGYSADLLLEAAATADGPERRASTHVLLAAAGGGVRESLLAVHRQRLARPVRAASGQPATASTVGSE